MTFTPVLVGCWVLPVAEPGGTSLPGFGYEAAGLYRQQKDLNRYRDFLRRGGRANWLLIPMNTGIAEPRTFAFLLLFRLCIALRIVSPFRSIETFSMLRAHTSEAAVAESFLALLNRTERNLAVLSGG